MYDVIVEAINNLKTIVEGQDEKLDDISDRLGKVENQIKLIRIGHQEHDWGEEVLEEALDTIEETED